MPPAHEPLSRPAISRPSFGFSLHAGLRRIAELQRPWSPRLDGAILASLVAFTLLTRIPHRTRYLNGWDSVLFALGMEEYDIPSARPHPPGYPVYIALAKVLQAFTGEPNSALVLLSILASSATVALLYGLMREFGSVRAAFAGAFLFSLTPFFLFNGVIALSYTCEAAAALGIAWLAWRTRARPTLRNAALLGIAWSLAVGLRQSLLFFVSPLVLYALVGPPTMGPSVPRRFFACGTAAATTTLAWFVPMIAATGGFDAWSKATSLQSGWVVFSESVFTKGWPAFKDHYDRLSHYVHYEAALLPALAAAVMLGFLAIGPRRLRALQAWKNWPGGAGAFLVVWLLPSFLFYLLIFNGWDKGPTGYALVLLPGVYALFAWAGDGALQAVERTARMPEMRRAATVIALPLLLFPAPSLQAGWSPLLEQEAQAHDKWADAWSRLPDSFSPEETAILAWYSWTHVKWYFPEYLTWSYMPIPGRGASDWVLTLQTQRRLDDRAFYEAHYLGSNQTEHPIPANVKRIVLFDFQLAGEGGWARRLAGEVEVEEEFLDDGWRVLFFQPLPDHPTIESHFRNVPSPTKKDGGLPFATSGGS